MKNYEEKPEGIEVDKPEKEKQDIIIQTDPIPVDPAKPPKN